MLFFNIYLHYRFKSKGQFKAASFACFSTAFSAFSPSWHISLGTAGIQHKDDEGLNSFLTGQQQCHNDFRQKKLLRNKNATSSISPRAWILRVFIWNLELRLDARFVQSFQQTCTPSVPCFAKTRLERCPCFLGRGLALLLVGMLSMEPATKPSSTLCDPRHVLRHTGYRS